MKKALDWTFTFKMGLVGVGVFMLLGFALGTTWVLRWSEEADQAAATTSSAKTNPRKPLRAQIMSFNTITLFFLLMSVAEFRTDGFLSPHGVDPEQIPPRCKVQQQAYTSVALGCALIIVLYNYFVFSAAMLSKPSAGNVLMQAKQGTAHALIKCMRSVKSKNTSLVVEVYPYAVEFFFFTLIAVFAILMYFLFVLANYGVIRANLFGACVAE